ncbi:Bug family tripartite tricarboxylate transporter substrate binding protein [Roseomonas sp. BN140053]|uniref:Bug family tripartite tricarboxylate transporter substrate binding protein n=1 Tax=Roseomonas sp. BN140053 TaxID=3391898 RepID=UPI0039ECBA3A
MPVIARRDLAALLGTALPAAALRPHAAGAADAFPARPIRVVIPYGAGGSINGLARMAIESMGRFSPQPFVADNRPGAAGTLASEHVVRSPADGYTVIFATLGTLLLHRYLYPNLSYDPRSAFAPIGTVAESPLVLVSSTALPAKNIAELVEFSRRQPDAATYAHTGTGSLPHLMGERLGELTGVRMLMVPYQLASGMTSDMIAGRVHMTFETLLNAQPMMAGGTIRALAVASPERLPQMPDVPTLAEAGYPALTTTLWTSFAVAAGTPPAAQEWLASTLDRALRAPETAESFSRFGVTPKIMEPDEFRALLAREDEAWRATAERVGRTPA